MGYFDKKFNTEITYWIVTGKDLYGNPTTDGPYHTYCRVENRVVTVTDGTSLNSVSKNVYYMADSTLDLGIGSGIGGTCFIIGHSTDPSPPVGYKTWESKSYIPPILSRGMGELKYTEE